MNLVKISKKIFYARKYFLKIFCYKYMNMDREIIESKSKKYYINSKKLTKKQHKNDFSNFMFKNLDKNNMNLMPKTHFKPIKTIYGIKWSSLIK